MQGDMAQDAGEYKGHAAPELADGEAATPAMGRAMTMPGRRANDYDSAPTTPTMRRALSRQASGRALGRSRSFEPGQAVEIMDNYMVNISRALFGEGKRQRQSEVEMRVMAQKERQKALQRSRSERRARPTNDSPRSAAEDEPVGVAGKPLLPKLLPKTQNNQVSPTPVDETPVGQSEEPAPLDDEPPPGTLGRPRSRTVEERARSGLGDDGLGGKKAFRRSTTMQVLMQAVQPAQTHRVSDALKRLLSSDPEVRKHHEKMVHHFIKTSFGAHACCVFVSVSFCVAMCEVLYRKNLSPGSRFPLQMLHEFPFDDDTPIIEHTPLSRTFKILSFASSMVGLLLIVIHHYHKHVTLAYLIADPTSTAFMANVQYWGVVLFDVASSFACPIPGFSPDFLNVSNGYPCVYSYDLVIGALSLIRLVTFVRLLYYYSRYTDPTRSIGISQTKYNVLSKSTPMFVSKMLLHRRPGVTLLSMMIISVFIGMYLVRACEWPILSPRAIDGGIASEEAVLTIEDQNSYSWNFAYMSMSIFMQGALPLDGPPKTNVARGVLVAHAFLGNVFIAFLIASVHENFNLTKDEQMLLLQEKVRKLNLQIPKAAAQYIAYRWRYKFQERNDLHGAKRVLLMKIWRAGNLHQNLRLQKRTICASIFALAQGMSSDV